MLNGLNFVLAHVPSIEQAANLATIPPYLDGRLNRYRQPRQRAVLRLTRFCANPLGIKLDQRVQLRIQALDLPYMLLGKFQRRNLPLLEQRKLLYRRQQRNAHGLPVIGNEVAGS